MSQNPTITPADIKEQKKVMLNDIFDILIETTGINHGKHLEYHRDEFLRIQLRDENSFASEYWFPADASDNMKLLFRPLRGFLVITQERTKKGLAAAENANNRISELKY